MDTPKQGEEEEEEDVGEKLLKRERVNLELTSILAAAAVVDAGDNVF